MWRRQCASLSMAVLGFLGMSGALADNGRAADVSSDWGEVEYLGSTAWIRRIGNMDVEYIGSTNWIRRIGTMKVEYIGSTNWIRRIGNLDVEYIGNTEWIRRIGTMDVEYIGNTHWIKYIGNRKSAGRTTTARADAPSTAASPPLRSGASATPAGAMGPARKSIDPVSRLGRGVQLHGEMEFQQALQQLEAAAKLDPNDPRVYVYLADTYRWLGMNQDANRAAERAKQLDPNAFEILRRSAHR